MEVLVISILAIIYLAMTFLTMFLLSVSIEDFYGEMFNDGIIVMSFFFWYLLIPVCAILWLIRLIAYPFRKCWW